MAPLFITLILGITVLSPFFSSSFEGVGVQAAPWPVQVKHATHRSQVLGRRGLKLETYHPKSSFKTYTPGSGSGSGSGSSSGSTSGFVSGATSGDGASEWKLNNSAIEFTTTQLGVDSSNIEYRKGWTNTHGSFAYMRQFIDGIPVANAVANIAYSNTSEVVSFGSSFIDTKGVTIPSSTPSKSWKELVPGVEATLGGKYFAVTTGGSRNNDDDSDITSATNGSSIPCSSSPSPTSSISSNSNSSSGSDPNLEYIVKPDGTLSLAYVMQIRNDVDAFSSNNNNNSDSGESNGDEDLMWVEAFVDAHTGELVSVIDFVAHATFNVVPITKQNFFDGREVLVDPEDLDASPNGWVAPAGQELGGVASGNNAIIFTNGSTSITLQNQRISITPEPSSSSSATGNSSGTEVFNNSYDPNSPFSPSGISATIDNAFYVMNTMHDFAFKYGFQENQGNFQNDNFGKGGSDGARRTRTGGEGDPVQVSIFDTSGVNNAVFSTPPDGIPGVARFFFFQIGGVTRDSAFANDVMVHEYTHGITGRMTGGGTGRCLQTLESGGMGEGWSDMMAAFVAQTSGNVDDFKMGTYFTEDGIRSKPYSVDERVNPLRFSDVGRLREVHSIGEIWANTLYNVYADLVQERGFSNNALTDADGLEGNVVFMRNMMDGLLLQPCNPTMLQARDAILQADVVRYNGANQCTMWTAFARKGMGVDAGDQFEDGFNVPPECA